MDDSFAACIHKIRKEKRIIMKYLKQFLIILVISLIGELLNKLLPLPVPASIYGMVILFIGLLSGVIKLSSVKEAGSFLIEIMPVMFIPAGVGLMSSWLNLKPIIIPCVHYYCCCNIYSNDSQRTCNTVYCKTY